MELINRKPINMSVMGNTIVLTNYVILQETFYYVVKRGVRAKLAHYSANFVYC